MDDLEAFGAETIADQAQASIQPDYADVSYGAPHLVTQAPPTLSPALSVVPEGDEQEGGEMKQQLTEQLDVQLESKYEDLNVGEVSASSHRWRMVELELLAKALVSPLLLCQPPCLLSDFASVRLK